MRWSCAGPKFLLLRLRQALRRSPVAACCYIKYRKSQQRDAHKRVSSARATLPALAPGPALVFAPGPADRASLALTPSALLETQALRPLAVAAMAPSRTATAHASVSSSMPVAAVALKAALALVRGAARAK